jgi:hypothetical protein
MALRWPMKYVEHGRRGFRPSPLARRFRDWLFGCFVDDLALVAIALIALVAVLLPQRYPSGGPHYWAVEGLLGALFRMLGTPGRFQLAADRYGEFGGY